MTAVIYIVRSGVGVRSIGIGERVAGSEREEKAFEREREGVGGRGGESEREREGMVEESGVGGS